MYSLRFSYRVNSSLRMRPRNKQSRSRINRAYNSRRTPLRRTQHRAAAQSRGGLSHVAQGGGSPPRTGGEGASSHPIGGRSGSLSSVGGRSGSHGSPSSVGGRSGSPSLVGDAFWEFIELYMRARCRVAQLLGNPSISFELLLNVIPRLTDREFVDEFLATPDHQLALLFP